MTQEAKIRLLVADDHEALRCGVKALLEGTEIKVVAEAANGLAAVKCALEKEIDVVLMDIRMPDGDGLTALGRIKLEKPNLPILLISAFENPAYIARGVAMGAAGSLLKGCTRDELIKAIRAAAAGENVWTHEELRRVSGSLRHAADERRPGSFLERARGRSLAADGLGLDQQADCHRTKNQLRDREGTRAAHPPQDRLDGPHAGGGLGGAQATGLSIKLV